MRPRCALPTCGRPSHNGYLCKVDRGMLHRRLAEIPARYEDLLITLARQGRTGEPTASIGTSTDGRIVLDLDAAELNRDLWRVLTRIVLHLVNLGEKTPCECGHAHSQHYAETPYIAAVLGLRVLRICWWRSCPCNAYVPRQTFSIRGMAQWLEHRADTLALGPAAGEILEQLNAISERIKTAIDQPQWLRIVPIGPCPETTDQGRRCTGVVRMCVPRAGEGMARYECPSCGVTYRPEQMIRLKRRMVLTPRPRPRDADPETGLLPAVPLGSARGGRAHLTTSQNDDVAVAGITTTDHQRKLDEGLIS